MSSGSPHKVAIVTGAARGIGKAIALRLVKDGFNVVISDLSTQKDNMAGVVQEAEGISVDSKCIAVVCDVTKEDEVQAMVARTLELFGRLDCVGVHFIVFFLPYTTPLGLVIDGRKCRDLCYSHPR